MKNISIDDINYKNVNLLQKFTTPAGSILGREKTGLSAKLQRRLTREIKRARHMALLPFTTQV